MNTDEIKTAPISDVVKTWNIELFMDPRDNIQKIIVRKGKQLPAGGFDVIKVRKDEAVQYLLAEKARKEAEAREREIHCHGILLFGWEAANIVIDDRKDIEEQITAAWQHHGDWCGISREQAAEQVYKQLAEIKQQREKEEQAAKDAEKSREEMEKLAATFEVVKTHAVQQARGGEDGIDGFADLTIRRVSDGEQIRVIEKNIFDFGHYGYPHNRGGTNAALDRSEWADLEKEAVAWVEKFGPLKNKNMRM